MQLISLGFEPDGRIPARHAMYVPDPDDHVALAPNRSPHLAWTSVPEDARSYALLCVDADGPTRPDDVNQEGRQVPADLPRTDFVHWVMVDLPADVTSLEEGAFTDGVTPGGRATVEGPYGTRQGLNDYTSWFAGDDEMEGVYRGYDGPGPPWNDARVHRYTFSLYALDVDRTPVDGELTASEVEDAIEPHVLEVARLTGTYSLNSGLSG